MPLGPDEPMFLPKGNTAVLAPRSKIKTGSTFEIMQKGLEIIINKTPGLQRKILWFLQITP